MFSCLDGVTGTVQGLTSEVGGVVGSATNVLGSATQVVGGVLGTATNLVGTATNVLGTATNAVGGVVETVSNVAGTATNAVGSVTKVVGTATNAVGGVVETVSNVAGTATNALGSVTNVVGTATNAVGGVVETVSNVAGTATNVVGTATNAVGGVVETVSNVAGTATNVVGTVTNVAGTVTNLAGSATNVAGTATQAVGGVTNVAGTATEAVGGVTNTATNLTGSVVQTATNVGGATSLVSKLLSGAVPGGAFKSVDDIANNLPSVLNALPELVPLSQPKNELPDFTKIENQAKEFYKTLPPSTLEDATLLVPNLIAKYGYPSEIHTIATTDGYNIALHRIPYGQTGATINRRAILLVHTILSSSAGFVVPGPKAGLAYLLADAGYDVWLANCRGNLYSRKHNTLSADDPKFWDFSFYEIGIYDCSAMIDYILNVTKQAKIYYVGHGQGTAAAHVLLSEQPAYNEKLAVCVSLAPMDYMQNSKSPLLKFISPFTEEPKILEPMIGANEFLPTIDLQRQSARFLPADASPSQILWTNVMFNLCGYTPAQMNTSILPVIMSHSPAGGSTKQVIHFIQEMRSGKFCKWDYGVQGNKSNYQAEVPPDYILPNITCPNIIFYGSDDWLSDALDVRNLLSQLTATKDKEAIELAGFNNLDYLYGIDAPVKVYQTLINKIVSY